jgi:hypothetical protein
MKDPLSGIPQDVPTSIATIARYAGWSTQRTRARLFHLHAVSGHGRFEDGDLLQRNGRGWLVVSVRRLRELGWTHFGGGQMPTPSAEQLAAELRKEKRLSRSTMARVRQLEKWADLVNAAIAGMTHDLLAWVEAGGKFPALPPHEPSEDDEDSEADAPRAAESDPEAAAWTQMSVAHARGAGGRT